MSEPICCKWCGGTDGVYMTQEGWQHPKVSDCVKSLMNQKSALQSALTTAQEKLIHYDIDVLPEKDREIQEAQEENKTLRESISSIYFQRPTVENMKEIRIDRCIQPDNSSLWAIRSGGFCLNKQGNWEFEPIPSSRTNKFYKDCRFNSMDEAIKFAQSALNGGKG